MLRTVSGWIVIFVGILSLILGSMTHWILGLIFFLVLCGKTLWIGLIMDTISGTAKYHHDRQDERVKKTLQSIRTQEAAQAGVKPKYADVKILNNKGLN